MELFNNWKDFLVAMAQWDSISFSARRSFLELKGNISFDANMPGKKYTELFEAGFVEYFVNGQKVRTIQKYQPFQRIVRSMHRIPLFENPDYDILVQYIQEHFTRKQRKDFSYQRYVYDESLAKHVSSEGWLNKFLSVKRKDINHWEESYGGCDYEDFQFSTLVILKSTQCVIQSMIEKPGPFAFKDLLNMFPKITPRLWAKVIPAGLRYMLFFVALRPEDLEPIIGVWPEIVTRLNRPAPPLPKPVKPKQPFHAAFLVQDMTTVLTICQSDPPRIRGNDYNLFAKAQKNFEANLISLPGWMEKKREFCIAMRINCALTIIQYKKLVTKKGKAGKDLRMELTQAGLDWLSKSSKSQLKIMLDTLKDKKSQKYYSNWNYRESVSFIPLTPYNAIKEKEELFLCDTLIKIFKSLPLNTFFNIQDFLSHHAVMTNPLIDLDKEGNPLRGYIDWSYVKPTLKQLEERWSEILKEFLFMRLAVLGCVQLALDDTDKMCFAMTEIGGYLVGQSDDFTYGENQQKDVLVQPNFDVVFLAPSPIAEAEISRFAQRKGKGIGVMFKITKASIFKAVEVGLTADDILATLKNVSSKSLPQNVVREIKGWVKQCCRITMCSTILIQCPDQETAAKVLSAGGTNISRITDSILELKNAKQKTTLIRKLRDMGIFS